MWFKREKAIYGRNGLQAVLPVALENPKWFHQVGITDGLSRHLASIAP